MSSWLTEVNIKKIVGTHSSPFPPPPTALKEELEHSQHKKHGSKKTLQEQL